MRTVTEQQLLLSKLSHRINTIWFLGRLNGHQDLGRSYRRISRIIDTGHPSFEGLKTCKQKKPQNIKKLLDRAPQETLIQGPLRTSYASDQDALNQGCPTRSPPVRSFAMREKGGNRLVPDPDYMVDALKLPNQAPRVFNNLVALHFKYDQARRRFVEWAQNEIAVVPDFHKRILFSDEAHFWLNGYVNKQNCRIWSEANPQVYVETPLHPEKLTVWCALWAGGIIGPYFFKNDEGHSVTVNGDRYRAIITNFFIPELNNHDVQELWFQEDGATCRTARATIDLLKDTFGDRLISRFGPLNWPPRSCDLTPLDYFLWGYVKSLVYADKPQTLDHLEDNIRRVIADIRPQMLEKVIENWTSRLDYIRASRGSHMPEIIFKM
ncbi:uncharacterized protein TNCV_3712771 [Trichonephila clavipes]|nr:uncharacterized protein TNCV_3712771 [Trichonephila clavipes]